MQTETDKSFSRDRLEAFTADAMFGLMRAQQAAYNLANLPVISTARPFEFYRTVFFEDASEETVLASLEGKTVVDIGCGLTPYMEDSMFQACRRAGVEFYGVDPKIGEGFKFGPFDRLKASMTGSRHVPDPGAPGLERGVAAFADNLPFADNSVDLIVSSWLLFVWISQPAHLAPIFSEFNRILKPGGEVRTYPQPKYESAPVDPVLQKAFAPFEISQQFLMKLWPITYFAPAYLTRYVKR